MPTLSVALVPVQHYFRSLNWMRARSGTVPRVLLRLKDRMRFRRERLAPKKETIVKQAWRDHPRARPASNKCIGY